MEWKPTQSTYLGGPRIHRGQAVVKRLSRRGKKMERVNGIEPSSSAWEAEVIPLYDTRFVLLSHLLDYRALVPVGRPYISCGGPRTECWRIPGVLRTLLTPEVARLAEVLPPRHRKPRELSPPPRWPALARIGVGELH